MSRSKLIVIFLIIFLTIPSLLSFLHKGFMVTDDGGWMVIRLAAFYDALRDGQFPVRWVNTLNFGYGYPVVNFLYPGFLYIGAPIFLLVSSYVLTIKILFVTALIAGPVGVYLWLSQKHDTFSSIVGSLLYVYLPYHLYTTTVRGSLGEVVFLGILPFLLYAIQTKRRFFISILLGLLLISHNTLALLFFPVILCFSLVAKREVYKRWTDIVSPLALGVGMSLFFWVPALVDLPQTRFFQTSVSDYGNYFASLSVIGIASFVVLLGSLIIFLKQKNRKYLSELGLFILAGLLSVFMASSLSDPFWRNLPVGFVQFPFRFLAILIVAVSYLAANSVAKTNRKYIVGTVLVGVVFFLSSGYLFPKEYSEFPESYYFTNQATTTVKNEYMPKGVSYDPIERFNQSMSVSGGGNVILREASSNKFSFEVTQPVDAITLSQLYFPGWTGYVDGLEKDILVEDGTGNMHLKLTGSTKNVEFRFKETPIRLFADIISLLSLLGSVWFFVIKKYAKI